MTSKLREEKWGELEEDIDDLQLRMNLIEQQRQKFSNHHDYAKALDASKRHGQLKQEVRMKQKELQLLDTKEKNM